MTALIGMGINAKNLRPGGKMSLDSWFRFRGDVVMHGVTKDAPVLKDAASACKQKTEMGPLLHLWGHADRSIL